MRNLRNSVQLIGNVGSAPEVKTLDSGRVKTTCSIATNSAFKNQKGEKVEETQWHNLVFWGKLAEVVNQYVKKGSEIAIEGKLVHRAYETAKGEKRYITEISVNDLVMLGSNRK
jgi:single-strand DNA-binding protein